MKKLAAVFTGRNKQLLFMGLGIILLGSTLWIQMEDKKETETNELSVKSVAFSSKEYDSQSDQQESSTNTSQQEATSESETLEEVAHQATDVKEAENSASEKENTAVLSNTQSNTKKHPEEKGADSPSKEEHSSVVSEKQKQDVVVRSETAPKKTERYRTGQIGNTGKEFATFEEADAWASKIFNNDVELKKLMDRGYTSYFVGTVGYSDDSITYTVWWQ